MPTAPALFPLALDTARLTLRELSLDDCADLGRAGLQITRPEHREATLWFNLRRDLWGQGLATEASAAMLTFAFDTLGMHPRLASVGERSESTGGERSSPSQSA